MNSIIRRKIYRGRSRYMPKRGANYYRAKQFNKKVRVAMYKEPDLVKFRRL
jgi:hypothetical protein